MCGLLVLSFLPFFSSSTTNCGAQQLGGGLGAASSAATASLPGPPQFSGVPSGGVPFGGLPSGGLLGVTNNYTLATCM